MCTLKLFSKRSISLFLLISIFILNTTTQVMATGYDKALAGITDFKAVFQFSQGNPKIANLVFWAVKNSYEVDEIGELKGDKDIVVVFHGPVVKLVSTNKESFSEEELSEVDKFQETIRQMKKSGVKFEVCLYAAKLMGVDESKIIPEIDKVGNGFVSVIGYQMQNYAVVRIP
ncbi:MAG: hypothetical protein C0614_06060 [Desulfuromonas sp.]|nr:MAG: hypothetical protein C0614_06060 [Desulfuromonas sp.]